MKLLRWMIPFIVGFVLTYAFCMLMASAVKAASFPDSYEKLATDFWGVSAKPGCETYGIQIEYTWQEEQLSWMGKPMDRSIVAMADIGGCHMWIKTDWWFSVPKMWRCTVFLHEWGHLLGFQHSPDFNNIMYPSTQRVPGICNRRGWRQLNDRRAKQAKL